MFIELSSLISINTYTDAPRDDIALHPTIIFPFASIIQRPTHHTLLRSHYEIRHPRTTTSLLDCFRKGRPMETTRSLAHYSRSIRYDLFLLHNLPRCTRLSVRRAMYVRHSQRAEQRIQWRMCRRELQLCSASSAYYCPWPLCLSVRLSKRRVLL